MKNLLIVGCGDVVRRVLPQLSKRWRVIALVRRRDNELSRLGVVQISGDLDQRNSLRRLAGIADAVIHSAPPPQTGSDDPRTRRLIACLRQGKSVPRHLVYISTSGVYGNCDGATVAETRPLAASSARAKRRISAEQQLRDFGKRSGAYRACKISILRAPGIYAADRLPLDRVRQRLPLIAAGEDSFTNHIHANDLGRACLAALHHGRKNRAYNINDDSDLAMGEWFDLLADSFQLPRAPRMSRAQAANALSPTQWSFAGESRRLVNRRMKRELGLRLEYPTVHRAIDEALEGIQ
jgi:nucleoside-diphosphate-sugar epimerase